MSTGMQDYIVADWINIKQELAEKGKITVISKYGDWELVIDGEKVIFEWYMDTGNRRVEWLFYLVDVHLSHQGKDKDLGNALYELVQFVDAIFRQKPSV